MNYIKKALWNEYGIKVKIIRLRGTLQWYGQKYYLPYTIYSASAGSIADLLKSGKIYSSLEQILEEARTGTLE